jgi:hypothetical protein
VEEKRLKKLKGQKILKKEMKKMKSSVKEIDT